MFGSQQIDLPLRLRLSRRGGRRTAVTFWPLYPTRCWAFDSSCEIWPFSTWLWGMICDTRARHNTQTQILLSHPISSPSLSPLSLSHSFCFSLSLSSFFLPWLVHVNGRYLIWLWIILTHRQHRIQVWIDPVSRQFGNKRWERNYDLKQKLLVKGVVYWVPCVVNVISPF